MLTRAIITPTYSGHFKYLKKYLKSFDKYLQDRDFPLYFIVNQSEADGINRLLHPYTHKLNIHLVYTEDIFARFKITETPEEALKKYGRLSFQTLKKFYGALYINPDEFLFLDSESMLIRPTNMHTLFTQYFSHPTFFISRISERTPDYPQNFTYEFLRAVTSLLHQKPQYWSIESYEWFYKTSILKEMIQTLGEPIDIIRAYRMPNRFPNVEGILEALLYYQYILYHNDKYNYTIKIVEDELPRFMGTENYHRFRSYFDKSPFNICGVLETAMFFIDAESADGFIRFLNHYHLHILRIEGSKVNSLQAQSSVVYQTDIHLCPSAQNHIYGINNTIGNRYKTFIKETQLFQKLRKHFKRLATAVGKGKNAVLSTCREFPSTVYYLLAVIGLILKNFKRLVWGK